MALSLRLIAAVVFSFGLVSLSDVASAARWDIVRVLQGSDGFGASSFHTPSSGNAMSGPILANIVENVATDSWFGFFDDVTGEFSGTFQLEAADGGHSFTLTNPANNGELQYGGPGFLGNPVQSAPFGFLNVNSSLQLTVLGGGQIRITSLKLQNLRKLYGGR